MIRICLLYYVFGFPLKSLSLFDRTKILHLVVFLQIFQQLFFKKFRRTFILREQRLYSVG